VIGYWARRPDHRGGRRPGPTQRCARPRRQPRRLIWPGIGSP